jgi:hypothetical protein
MVRQRELHRSKVQQRELLRSKELELVRSMVLELELVRSKELELVHSMVLELVRSKLVLVHSKLPCEQHNEREA